jgi:hypothetical protein
MGKFRSYTKFRRPGFSRKALRAYLQSNPNKKHRCGDAKACVVADYIADSFTFPKGTDTVYVFGNTIEFSNDRATKLPPWPNRVRLVYTAPKWVKRVVDKFDHIKGARGGLVTGSRCEKELESLLK